MDNSKQPSARVSVDSLAGAVIGLTTLLSLIVVLHHPVLQGVHGANETAQAIQSLGAMDRWVHGALMAIIAAQTVGFYYFSARLGFRNPAALTGFLAFAAGGLIMIIPTTLDGFVHPDMAGACLATSTCGASQAAVIELISIAIQDFTKVAMVSMSVGTLFWSLALAGRRGAAFRAVGLAGLVCALVPLAVLLRSNIHLGPSSLAALMLAQVVWNLAVAALMVGAKTWRDDPAQSS